MLQGELYFELTDYHLRLSQTYFTDGLSNNVHYRTAGPVTSDCQGQRIKLVFGM